MVAISEKLLAGSLPSVAFDFDGAVLLQSDIVVRTPGYVSFYRVNVASFLADAPKPRLELCLKVLFPSLAVPQGFTSLSSRIDAEQVCTFLHELFATFDRICESLGIHKWATVGGAPWSGFGDSIFSARVLMQHLSARPREPGYPIYTCR